MSTVERAIRRVPKQVYEAGILDPGVHGRMLMDLDRVTTQAGIPVSAIWTPLSKVCTLPVEIQWTKRFWLHAQSGVSGLLYLGTGFQPPVIERFFALAGALVRNFVDARVMTVQDVIERRSGGDPMLFSALLIPNFCLGGNVGKLTDWKMSELSGLLLERFSAGKQTVLYAESEQALSVYGTVFVEHLNRYFLKARP